MCPLFHCLQWYTGSERVEENMIRFFFLKDYPSWIMWKICLIFLLSILIGYNLYDDFDPSKFRIWKLFLKHIKLASGVPCWYAIDIRKYANLFFKQIVNLKNLNRLQVSTFWFSIISFITSCMRLYTSVWYFSSHCSCLTCLEIKVDTILTPCRPSELFLCSFR